MSGELNIYPKRLCFDFRRLTFSFEADIIIPEFKFRRFVFMNGFIKLIVSLLALFGAAVGALAVFDKISNKYRIKGDYLDCDTSDGCDTDNENE